MTIVEILDSVRYVVNGQGVRTAVQIDLSIWEVLRQLLEDKEDIADIQQARVEEDTVFDWSQVVAEYQMKHDVMPHVSD